MQKVGFIGLGLMGSRMAPHIVNAGYPVTVYNRTTSKAEPLRAMGAQVADSPAEVAQKSDVVITMMTDSRGVEAVLFGLDSVSEGNHDGLVVIDMSTIAPDQSQGNASRLSEFGIKMLDAPVGGSVGAAEGARLAIMVGGDETLFQTYRDLLATMGQSVVYVGGQGSGAAIKLARNLAIAAQAESLAESLALAAKCGVDLDKAIVVLTGNESLTSGVVKRMIGQIKEDDFEPRFTLENLRKDLDLIVHTANSVDASIPSAAAINQVYNSAVAQGYGGRDFLFVYHFMRKLSGLE